MRSTKQMIVLWLTRRKIYARYDIINIFRWFFWWTILLCFWLINSGFMPWTSLFKHQLVLQNLNRRSTSSLLLLWVPSLFILFLFIDIFSCETNEFWEIVSCWHFSGKWHERGGQYASGNWETEEITDIVRGKKVFSESRSASRDARLYNSVMLVFNFLRAVLDWLILELVKESALGIAHQLSERRLRKTTIRSAIRSSIDPWRKVSKLWTGKDFKNIFGRRTLISLVELKLEALN